MSQLPPRARVCPRCGRPIRRVRRRFTDRLISLFVPVLRFRCEAAPCGWEGLIRGGHTRVGGHGSRDYVPRHALVPSRGAPTPARSDAAPEDAGQRHARAIGNSAHP